MKYVNLALELILFSGFIWTALKFFRRIPGQEERFGQKLIKILGSLQIASTVWWTIEGGAPETSQILASVIFLISTVYFYWALRISIQHREHFNFALSDSSPNIIVRGGPYKHLRHPFYFSYMAAWVASIIETSFYPLNIAIFLILSSCYLSAANQEEREFKQIRSLDSEYKKYVETTWKLFPGIY